jgi:hypothetical protein
VLSPGVVDAVLVRVVARLVDERPGVGPSVVAGVAYQAAAELVGTARDAGEFARMLARRVDARLSAAEGAPVPLARRAPERV